MSISTEITRLQNAKASIKTSIESKGVTVPSSAKLDDYSSYIDQISTGGGSNTDLVDLIEGNLISFSNSEVEEVAPYAFYKNTTLEVVSLPNVKIIGDSAFANCTSLGGNVSFPKLEYFFGNGITVGNVFDYSKITSFSAPDFSGTRSVKTNPSDFTIIGFYACTSLKTVYAPYIRNVGSGCFRSCTSLESVTLSSNLQIVDEYGFYDCGKLSSFSYESITGIGNYAFAGCVLLTEIYAPLVTVLGRNAFDNCTSLTTVTLKCSQIPQQAFRDCSALTTIKLLRTSVCSLANSTNCLPASATQHITIYVPSDLITSYQTATNWSTLYNNGYITFMAIEE